MWPCFPQHVTLKELTGFSDLFIALRISIKCILKCILFTVVHWPHLSEQLEASKSVEADNKHVKLCKYSYHLHRNTFCCWF